MDNTPIHLAELRSRSVGAELAAAVVLAAALSPALAIPLGWAWRVFTWAAGLR